jgi:hypothetical protein
MRFIELNSNFSNKSFGFPLLGPASNFQEPKLFEIQEKLLELWERNFVKSELFVKKV